MKKQVVIYLFSLLIFSSFTSINAHTGSKEPTEVISFYEVPLVCGAAPEIGCGSRLKPLFIDTEKEKSIKESWSNRQGTFIAIIWNDKVNKPVIKSLFKKHAIEAQLITNNKKEVELTASLKGKDKWYKGMEVDQLSIEEAGIIAASLTDFAQEAELITEVERSKIKDEIEEYFKKELVIVRTVDELKSEETQERWRTDGYQIYVNNIGKERADKVSELYHKHSTEDCKSKKESCCTKKDSKCCQKK